MSATFTGTTKLRLKRLFTFLCLVAAAFFLLLLVSYFYLKVGTHGFSALAEPSKMETVMAELARAAAIPSSAHSLKNPIAISPAAQDEAMAHFADHCAVCHANNGSGQTMFGKGMYPKPPDLRLGHTQAMTDGEIFYIIENGIRLSGMPAFGGTDTGDGSWKLVHFIRHLPQLTAAEEARMDSLNPKSPEELQEENNEEQFLKGGPPLPKTSTMDHQSRSLQ